LDVPGNKNVVGTTLQQWSCDGTGELVGTDTTFTIMPLEEEPDHHESKPRLVHDESGDIDHPDESKEAGDQKSSPAPAPGETSGEAPGATMPMATMSKCFVK
jgi:hypothetical protein